MKNYSLTVKQSFSIVVFYVMFLFSTLDVMAFPVPDTGQTKCYDNSAEIPCPESGQPFYGQDAQHQGVGASFTKLAEGGEELHESATLDDGWVMTRDNITGLIWEIKTDDGSIHDKDKKFVWNQVQSDFVDRLNMVRHGGYSDWRFPTIQELGALRNSELRNSGLGLYITSYWTADEYAKYSEYAWYMDLTNDGLSAFPKGTSFFVIAVRAGDTD